MNAALPIGFGRRTSFVPFFDHACIDFQQDGKIHIYRIWKWTIYVNLSTTWLRQRMTWLRYKLEVFNARLAPVKLWLRGYQAPYYVNIYAVDRNYGGSEEGGWYYDSGEPFDGVIKNSYACESHDEAVLVQEWLRRTLEEYQPQRNRYSVIGDADIVAHIEEQPAEHWPSARPYYC